MLAPNVTLALEILRMPTMELQTYLTQQLEENPFLELDEVELDEEQPQQELEPTPEQDGAPATPGHDDDWTPTWRTGAEHEDDDDDNPRDTGAAVSASLHDTVTLQLGCLPLSPEDRRLGEGIIRHLDEYGYLDDPLEVLAQELAVPIEQLDRILKLIQSFDPPGVGARDLRECLMIQLELSGASQGLAYRILAEQFPLFASRKLQTLAKAIGVSPEETAGACDVITKLNPKPGRAFGRDLPPAIVPDLVISKRERHYDVEINDQELPRISLNRAYRRMLKDPNTPADAKEFLAKKFRQASWVVRAIDERNGTLLSIARCLLSLQQEFIEHGPRALKPLTQEQVASLVGRHPSTVSRAIASKTIDTPYGVFRLEQFFASNVPQPDRENGDREHGISDGRIKSEIQRLVDEENRQSPLSDETMAVRLRERNITVARRTVAKYRTSLKILPAHLRKHRA